MLKIARAARARNDFGEYYIVNTHHKLVVEKDVDLEDEAHKVLAIISADKAKTQTYCEIQNLGEQIERAYEKRNLKLVDELLQKIDALELTLGPEYIALMDRLADVDPEKDKLGAEIMSVFDALGGLCPR